LNMYSEYMFKQTIAEGLYRTSRAALDSTLLSQLLASTTAIDPLVAPASRPPVTDSPVTTVDDGSSLATPETSNDNLNGHSLDVETAPSAAADVKDDDTSSEGGDIFGTMLDEMPSQETNDVGTVISVVDFALAKSFSGKTPQSSLSPSPLLFI
jgi:ATP-dependent RNA helicase DHX29